MKKRVVALILAVAMTLCACGGTDKNGNGNTGSQTKENQAEQSKVEDAVDMESLRQGAPIDEEGNVEAILPYRYVAKSEDNIPVVQTIMESEGFLGMELDENNNIHYKMTPEQRFNAGRRLIEYFEEDVLPKTYEVENTQITKIEYNDDFTYFTITKDLTKEGNDGDEWDIMSLMIWSITYQSFMGITEEDGFPFEVVTVDAATGDQIAYYNADDYKE